ncbi:beta-carotene 15,15'-monooxygenase [Streptococcus gallolyticus]|uniref:beta-carotene 15,15'-monooxygenase n=1 Tax=Streptococcus gallolyticus TaxID=315405 RepID=UPI0020980BBD|nr:beta-carotene 15,15'-monooxygenase [Streptococcus gallolyticus]MCO7179448.1 beta-carotene 15,15'-monooxygenase [Streptococcus gallolyticus]
MDFELFEKRNWFQLVRNRIIRVSDGSVAKQDFFSTLLLLGVFSYMVGGIKFLWDNGINEFVNLMLSYLLSIMFNINSFVDYFLGSVNELILYEPNVSLSFSFSDLFNDIFGLVVRFIFSVIPLFIIYRLFSRESFRNEIIKSISTIVISILVFEEYRFTISIGLITIVISATQFGNGSLFRFVSNLLLFMNPFISNFRNGAPKQSPNTIKVSLWFISWLMVSKIISILFGLPIATSVLLVIVLMVRFGLQFQLKNPYLEILLKGIIYSLVFSIVLLTNNTTNEMISLFTVSIAIYFAVDRFFSLYKEIEVLVKNDEINYYLYFDSSLKILEQRFLPDEFLFSVITDIDEKKLYGQLIIRSELGMKDSFENLASLIKKQREYKTYELLLISLEYKHQKIVNEKLTITNFIEQNLYNEILYDEQVILPIEFLVLYGSELKEQEEYQKASEYLRFSEYYNSYKYIDSYFHCVEKINNEIELERLNKKYYIH